MKDTEPLSGVDAAWLRMDEPTNLMTITAVLVLEDPMDVGTARSLVEERLLGFTRFRQRVRDPEGQPWWEIDPHFDLEQHVRRSALPGAAGRDELQARVSELMSTPLDRSKPLWHIEVIEDYRGGSALVVRIHHCIGDGIALVQVLLSLTDEYFDAARFPDTERRRALLPGALSGSVQAVQAAAEAGRSLVAEGVESILRPRHLLHRAQQGMSVGAALAKVGLMGQDDDTAFKGDLGVAQRAAWSKAIDLVAVKRLGHAIDAKVNDVLLGAVAGALRHYLDRHGEPVEGASVRALIPVNLRSIESAFELGNRFGLVYLDLPVGEPDRLRRVLKVKRRMDEIKASSEAAVTFGVLQALGYCPIEMEAQAVRHFSSRASAVMTNVPGPQEELRMRGRRLQNIMPWVPRAGEIGLGVSVFSYDGEVRLGVACDAGLIPDPGAMLDGFEDEFDRLTDRLAPVAAGMEE